MGSGERLISGLSVVSDLYAHHVHNCHDFRVVAVEE